MLGISSTSFQTTFPLSHKEGGSYSLYKKRMVNKKYQDLPEVLREEFEILCELGVDAEEARYLISTKRN